MKIWICCVILCGAGIASGGPILLATNSSAVSSLLSRSWTRANDFALDTGDPKAILSAQSEVVPSVEAPEASNVLLLATGLFLVAMFGRKRK